MHKPLETEKVKQWLKDMGKYMVRLKYKV